MRILLFGGTTEGRELARTLSDLGYAVTACVVSELGAEELRGIPGLDVRVGRMPASMITELLPAYDLCVDATHPYAAHISATLRTACAETGVPLRRVLRPAAAAEACVTVPDQPAACVTVPDQPAAAAFLAEQDGNIMLTTGAKELAAYAGLATERLFIRVLPTHEALAACEAVGLPHKNIIAMQGPFSEALNEALFRQYGVRWVVTKDGGQAGGVAEKLAAAGTVGARVVLVARPEDEGVAPEALLAEIMEGTL